MDRQQAIALDVDRDTLAALREALPMWAIEATRGVTAHSVAQDWNPGPVDLVLLGARQRLEETLGLCRGLRSQAGRAHTAILVLVTPDQQPLVRAALTAGADGCLVLPVHAKQLVDRLTRVLEDRRPGRHTLDLEPAQDENPWQDDGGEA
jgi:DNA-binding response OmpR family regulator